MLTIPRQLLTRGTLALLLSCTLAGPVPTRADPLTYRWLSLDIPTPAGVLGLTDLTDINDEGQMVGVFLDSSGPGFLLDRDLTLRDLRCPGTAPAAVGNVVPQGINNRGEVIGTCTVDGRLRSFLRSRRQHGHHEVFRLLVVARARRVEVMGVSDEGRLVGDFNDEDDVTHGFVLTHGHLRIFDAAVPGATTTVLTGMNDAGQMVGWYDLGPGGPRRGFLVSEDETFTAIDIPGAVLVMPLDINDAGQIVGVYALGETPLHSFVWDAGEVTTLDVPFAGVIQTEVSGMNNRGQLVGRYLVPTPSDPVNPFASHGFIATPAR